MITNPKTFFEQFQNFIEESGLQLKKFKSNLSNYFTKAEAIDTFLGKTDKAESAKKADEAIKATQDSEGNVISSTYLKTSNASTTYLTQANASSTYLTKTGKATSASTADTAGSANTATKATQDASGNVITATYATKAELSNKLDTSSAFTKAQADNLYLSKSAKATSASVADTATSATKATQDASGNIITSTYATKTELNAKQDTATAFKQTDADKLYLAKVGKAVSATSADSATKASQDASGNDIPTTYATKAEVTSGLSGKLDKTAKATSATTADSASSVPWTGVSGKPQLIPGTGDAGTIKTYETVVAATTVSDSSARSMSLANGGTLTVNNGSANKAWITVVALAGSATITLGSSWSWSGVAPALAKGIVTLAWYGTFGVATFTKFGS